MAYRTVERNMKQALPSSDRHEMRLRVPSHLFRANLTDWWSTCNEQAGCHDVASETMPRLDQGVLSKIHAQLHSRRHKVVLVTGCSVRMMHNPMVRAMIANKRLYASNHGYPFELYASDVFLAAQGMSEVTGATGGESRSSPMKKKGEFTKILMIWSALRKYPKADWVMMLDHDVWFHPSALTGASLDLFLDDVPREKVYGYGNYHSLNTGAVFIRQGVQGRHLVMMLLGIVQSNLIECHAWDQAATQLLLLYSLSMKLHRLDSPTPFNFSCTKPSCAHPDGRDYWSCDIGYEVTLEKALGSRDAVMGYLRRGASPVDVPHFHVLVDGPRLPRFQCMYCEQLHTVSRVGVNYPIAEGAVNGWFLTHKGYRLFNETFMVQQRGTRFDDFAIPDLAFTSPLLR